MSTSPFTHSSRMGIFFSKEHFLLYYHENCVCDGAGYVHPYVRPLRFGPSEGNLISIGDF